MKLALRQSILLSLVCQAISIQISADNPENGLIFEQTETLYMHDMNRFLFYKFEIPTIAYIISWVEGATKKCKEFENAKSFELNNTFWKQFNPEPKISNKFVRKSIIKYHYEATLNKNIEEFNLKSGDENECKILIEMANNFNEMNKELNRLARLDFTSLDKIINFKQIKTDAIAEMMNINEGQYYIPFNLSKSSIREFFKYTKFNFYHDDIFITLSLQIPNYKAINLFTFFEKPIIYKNRPFLLNTTKKYVYFTNGNPIFVDDEYIFKNCFYTDRKNFCEMSTDFSICEAETFYMNLKSEKCLKKLPIKNVITKINTDLYVTIITPIVLEIDCGQGNYKIKLNKHLKLTNEKNCTINTTQFFMNPKIETQKKYDMYFLDFQDVSSFDASTIYLWEFYFTLVYVILTIIIYIATICTGIYELRKRISIINQDMGETYSQTATEFHVYATISE